MCADRAERTNQPLSIYSRAFPKTIQHLHTGYSGSGGHVVLTVHRCTPCTPATELCRRRCAHTSASPRPRRRTIVHFHNCSRHIDFGGSQATKHCDQTIHRSESQTPNHSRLILTSLSSGNRHSRACSQPSHTTPKMLVTAKGAAGGGPLDMGAGSWDPNASMYAVSI